MKWMMIPAVLLSACSAAQSGKQPSVAPTRAAMSPTPTSIPTTVALPADVVAFRQRRDSCDELRGEEPYDAARAAQLNRAVRKACTGTDAALAALRVKYRGEPTVGAALAGYEERVE